MMKGAVIYFHTKDGSPFYAYRPLDLIHPEEIQYWHDTTIDKYQSEPYNYVFIKVNYWKLEKLSCVLVSRNKDWFKNNVGQLEKVWKTIEQERISGYEHRAPTKKQKKEQPAKPYVDSNKEEICLLKVIKIE